MLLEFWNSRILYIFDVYFMRCLRQSCPKASYFAINERFKHHLMLSEKFSNAFKTFDEGHYFKNLFDKFSEKTFYQKYRNFWYFIIFLSVLFNLLSLASGAYAVYDLSFKFVQIMWVAIVIALVILACLEKVKRYSSGEFWQVFWFKRKYAYGWLCLSLFCAALSIASSMYGTYEGTEDLGPGAELVATDSVAQSYRTRIAQLEEENQGHQANKNKAGETYWPSQQAILENKSIIKDLEARAMQLETKLEGHNAELTKDYREELALTASFLMWLSFIFELLFEAAMAYIEYYRYRSFIERWLQLGYPVTSQGRPILSFLEELDEKEQQQLLGNGQHPSPTLPSRSAPDKIHDNQQLELETALSKTLAPFMQRLENLEQRIHNSSMKNGQHEPPSRPTSTMMADRPRPIGYHIPKKETEIFVQDFENDLYTVPHMYTKKGETIIKPYGESLIQGRINQYAKLVETLKAHSPYPTQAEEQKHLERLQEKQEILAYWEGKMIELHKKQIAANIREPNTVYKRAYS